MDSSLTKKENGGSNSHSVFMSSLSYSDSEVDLEVDLGEGPTVSGSKLRAVLDKQLVYISGGLEEDRRPILTFPEVGLKHLESPDGFKELTTTLLYFKTLTCFAGFSAGISLLLDARNTKTHGPVKQLLDKLVSGEIPLDVHVVYIYMKSRIFGRGKQLAGSETASKLQIKYLCDQKALLDQLESSNVTTDLGGALCYDHKSWVHNRLEYEKVRQMHSKTVAHYPKFTEALDHSELPNGVKEAEQLMQADLKLKETFGDKMAEAALSADRFLETLKQQQPGATMQMALDTKEHIKMMVSLKLIQQELKEKQEKLSSFWLVHKAHMEHVIHMCSYNERAEEIRVTMRGYTDNVNKEGSVLGDTLEAALEYGEKFGELVAKCKATLDENMEKISEDAQVLINPDFASDEEGEMHSATQQAIDSVKEQVEELKKNYKELTDLCQQKRDTFVLCVKFHMMTRQVQQWNQDVLEFLATLYLEDVSEEDFSANLSKIEEFSDSIEVSQLTTITELANLLPVEKKFKKTAGTVKEKYEQVCGLLDVRKSHILKKLAALRTPDPPPAIEEEEEQIENIEDNSNDPTLDSEREPATNSQSLPTININDGDSSLAQIPEEGSSEHTDGESDANVLKSRQFVYKELLATEKVYIDDLKTVLNSYYDAMDPEESTSIPLRLRDKRSVVFGNLPEVYKFHETVFSKALEQYEDHPANIGECFVQHMEEFQMYADYCKNRTQSEALINESTESQAFFKGIQLNLAHQLSLDSYLLKPVQRITKYQLLLKDMMKHSVQAKVAHSKLKKALDGMLKVLKNLNDSLHVVGLKGFPGSLAEQGRLLVHDPFQLWEKSAVSRSLFSRAHERHVFLFEKMIIFSKKTEAASQKKEKKSDNYLYKAHLSMAEIGLRAVIGSQPLQFELNLHGQQKVYTLQAQNKKVYDMWTSEIRRLLEAQLVLMKDIVIKSGTLNKRAYKGKTKLSTHARDSRFFADPVETQSLLLEQIKRQKNGRVKKKKAVHSGVIESSPLVTQSVPLNAVYSIKEDELAMSEDDLSDEDDISIGTAIDLYETLAPSAPRHCLAISDYNPGDSDENGISLTEAQEVEVIGVNQFGWWWVRATNASSGEMEEGWVPASYLRCQLTHL